MAFFNCASETGAILDLVIFVAARHAEVISVTGTRVRSSFVGKHSVPIQRVPIFIVFIDKILPEALRASGMTAKYYGQTLIQTKP